ncbi:MAG: AAA family ATPase [Candidatus Methanomethylophilaceae archaeon]
MLFKRKATDKLKQWKEQSDGTYAALLEGARRTGKSTIAEAFAKVEYQSYIKVDFAEVSNDVLNVFSSLSLLDDFFLRLQAVMGVTLYPRKSVIIFDEVQLQPKVRQAIKYLVKDRRYDYIETGSLLSIRKNVKDIVIPSEEWKIPVYPMDYEEFLWATGRQDFSLLRQMYVAGKPVGQAVNRSLMRDYRFYMAV